jgi:hypothetical protein
MIPRVLSTLLGLAVLVVAFVFASILLFIGLAAALLLGGWIWWRGRGRVVSMRRGRVIEGESRVVDDQIYHLRPGSRSRSTARRTASSDRWKSPRCSRL